MMVSVISYMPACPCVLVCTHTNTYICTHRYNVHTHIQPHMLIHMHAHTHMYARTHTHTTHTHTYHAIVTSKVWKHKTTLHMSSLLCGLSQFTIIKKRSIIYIRALIFM